MDIEYILLIAGLILFVILYLKAKIKIAALRSTTKHPEVKLKKSWKIEDSEEDFEKKHGPLPCNGLECSPNHRCDLAERMFCRDVLEKILPKDGYLSQYELSLPSGIRRIDFVFTTSDNKKVAIELDGFTSHIEQADQKSFNDQLTRQNELVLDGWTVLRFSFGQLKYEASYCIECISKILSKTKDYPDINGQKPATTRALRPIFTDIWFLEGETLPAKMPNGLLWSTVRQRWYFLEGFETKEVLPETWKLTRWTACPFCKGRSFQKTGKFGAFWKCQEQKCGETFKLIKGAFGQD